MLENIFISIFITSLIGTGLWMILMLFKTATRKIFSPSWNYYIWLCVLVVMMLPLRITLLENDGEIAPKSTAKQATQIETTEVMLSPFDTEIQAPDNDTEVINVQDTPANTTHTLRQIVPTVSIAWAVIAVAIFIMKLVRYLVFVVQTYRTSFPVDIPQIKSKHISSRISSSISSPLMTGIFKPVLLLPDIKLSDEQIDNIILHEMTHYKRCDMLVKWFSVLAKSIHFFNPAVYFICRQLDEECELSCDAVVVKDMTREEEISYVNTIIDLLSENSSENVPLTTGMAGDKKTLKKRFLLIKNKKRISKKLVFVSVVAAFLIIGIAFIVGGILNGAIVKENKATNTALSLLELAVDLPQNYETDSGVGVEIAFESDDMLIFYGDFGLFGYDLRANEIEFSVDFVKAVGIKGSVQGSHGTAVDVSDDGSMVVISEYDVETEARGKACYIHVPSLTYERGEYEPLENPFNKEKTKGFIYPGVKINQIKYIVGNKEWRLFGSVSINTDLNLTDGNSSSFRTRYIFEFYGMLDFVSELVDRDALSSWMKQFESGERSLWELTLFTAVNELGISKESLLQANEQSGKLFTDEQIASLYLNDIRKVNECFVNPYALLHDGEIYTPDWLATHTAEDYKRIGITADELKEYLNKINVYELNFAYVPIATNMNSMVGFGERITKTDVDIGTYIVIADGTNFRVKCKEYGIEYVVRLNFQPDHIPVENAFYWIRGTYDFENNIINVQSPEGFHCPQRYMHTD